MLALSAVESAVAHLLEKHLGSVYGYDASSVHLAPWAVFAAAELRRQFGDDVDLDVGAFPYPPGRQTRYEMRPPRTSDSRERPMPEGMTEDLQAPAEVRSGHTAPHPFLVHNRTSSDISRFRTALPAELGSCALDLSQSAPPQPGTGPAVSGR